MVVFGRPATPLANVPKSASVITGDEIARASTANITDLLAREAGLNPLSFFGADKFGGIDMRGMGAAAVSNVLVLIDGVRINAPDLQGADYTSLPLAGLDRIEIIRGANAARFGGGAVGGVINLVTRPITGEEPTRLAFSARSYGTIERRLSAAHAFGPLAGFASATLYDSDGYRDNGGLDKRDYAVELVYRPEADITGSLRFDLHTDEYGLPGPVSRAVLESGSESELRATGAPEDGGETWDGRLRAELLLGLGRFGEFEVGARYRDRSNPYLIGYSPSVPRRHQLGELTEQTLQGFADYRAKLAIYGQPVDLSVGVDLQSTDYARYENGRGVLDRSSAQLGQFTNVSMFAAVGMALPLGFGVDLAWRGDRRDFERASERLVEVCDTDIRTELVEIDPVTLPGVTVPIAVPVETNCRGETLRSDAREATWRNQAFDLGFTWSLEEHLTAFANLAQSYRNPNVDELTLAASDLGPQTGQHAEVGIRYRGGRRLEAALTVFGMRIDDEILFAFDTATRTSVNLNAPETVRRTGAEFELRARPVDRLYTELNVGLVDARFTDSGDVVPLTPSHTVSGAIGFDVTPSLSAELRGRHVAARPDGNDLPNGQFDRLDPYTTLDLRLDFRAGAYTLFAGMNNLANARYTTIAYSGTVYPMPDRNFYAGFTLEL